MSRRERTEFPAKAPDHLCPGVWMDNQRNMQMGGEYTSYHAGWGPCEKPKGHLGRCGPRAEFDTEVQRLGKQGCHVVASGQQRLLV